MKTLPMRPLLRLLFLLLLNGAAPCAVAAEPAQVTVHYFRAEGCPHCAQAGDFLQRLAAEEPRVSVRDYEVQHNQTNREFFLDVVRALQVEEAGGLLLGMHDRRRMWILGIAFLAGSGIVYFLIMAAWLNVLLTIGLIFWVRLAVALVALAGSAYYFHDFLTNRDASCTVSHAGKRQAYLARLRRHALEERLWPAFIGVVALAVAVNLIELVCSAGIPAVYTQILALTPMPAWQYYGYLLLYLLVFLFDDILIFALAASTLQFADIGTHYARASRLLGGTILAVVGVVLLFRPQWLAFG